MALGYTGSFGAGGAAAGLETLLARRFKEQQAAEQAQQFQRQQAEVERARQAQEAYNLQQLKETGLLRQSQLAESSRAHRAGEEDRDLARSQQVDLRTLMGIQAGEQNKQRQLDALERQQNQISSAEGIAKASRENSAAIAAGNQDIRRDAAAEKRADQAAEARNKRKTVVGLATETASVLDQLLTPEGQLQPGVSKITGGLRVPAMIARNVGMGEVTNRQAAMDRLKSRVVVDLVGEMKAQSRTGATGFGQLSEKEGMLLEQAAAQLNQAQSEEQIRTVLTDMRGKLNRILQEPDGTGGAATQAGPPPGTEGVVNGQRAIWDGKGWLPKR